MATATVSQTRLPQISRIQSVALVVGLLGLAGVVAGFFVDSEQFLKSYLFGFYAMVGLPIGCLGALLVQHLTGGVWGVTTRRMLEAGVITWPIVGLLFIPIIAGAFNLFGHEHYLYKWADPAYVTEGGAKFDPIIYHKVPWLSPVWFTGRAIIYFVVFSGIAIMLRNWSLAQDRNKAQAKELAAKMRMLSGFGVLMLVLGVTFASFDWTMSLDPHWFSTMYGAHFLVSSVLMTLAFLIMMITQLKQAELLRDYGTTKPVHDLGKLMFAFTILWTYMSFGQYVIIWSGDIAEFTPWFIERTQGGWQFFVIALMGLAFFAPFFVLLSRRNKRNLNVLAGVAAFVFLMRFIDLMWVVLPYFHEQVFEISWMDFAAPIGMFGIWIALFTWNLQKAPILPVNDPNMEALAFTTHHGGHH